MEMKIECDNNQIVATLLAALVMDRAGRRLLLNTSALLMVSKISIIDLIMSICPHLKIVHGRLKNYHSFLCSGYFHWPSWLLLLRSRPYETPCWTHHLCKSMLTSNPLTHPNLTKLILKQFRDNLTPRFLWSRYQSLSLVFPSALVRSLGSWWASSLLLRWVDNFDNLDFVNTLDFVDIAHDVDNCADGCWFPHGLVLMISHFLLIVSFYWRADIWNQKIQKCKYCYQIGETQVKSIASSISTTFNWTLAFLVTKFFSDMVINHGQRRWHYTHLR